MTKVVICQSRLVHYRESFFERLRSLCTIRDINLHLVYGQASARDSTKKDEGSLWWANQVKNRYLRLGAHDLVWQPFPANLRDANLIIVTQENRILSNYPLLLSGLKSDRKIAYWGHGANFQSDSPRGIREIWKRALLTRVDWWFAYTETTRDIVYRAGYPNERITCLYNAIDTGAFAHDLSRIPEIQVRRLRDEINAADGAPVGLFCGSLYPDKRLDYMIEAADRIHATLPKFRLVVIGDGPSAHVIQAASETRSWLRWLGTRKGLDKAAWFRVADIIINPGLVGLHILDAFSAGKPMVTTAEARHSPEISYLENKVNGLIVHGDASNYAAAVIALLNNADQLSAIKMAALRAAGQYTLDNMVGRFADGIGRCLATPKKSRLL